MLRTAIETADPSRLGEATKAVEQVMLTRFGEGPVEGEMKALIVTATKPRGLKETSDPGGLKRERRRLP
jgi:hypothetical protein